MLYPVQNIKLLSPNIKNDSKRLHVFFNGGNYLHQDIIAIPNNVIIYCVYELDPIDFSRNNEFTIQNAFFGAIEITKMQILQSINTKDMVFVLMKVRNLFTYEKKVILIILRWLET